MKDDAASDPKNGKVKVAIMIDANTEVAKRLPSTFPEADTVLGPDAHS